MLRLLERLDVCDQPFHTLVADLAFETRHLGRETLDDVLLRLEYRFTDVVFVDFDLLTRRQRLHLAEQALEGGSRVSSAVGGVARATAKLLEHTLTQLDRRQVIEFLLLLLEPLLVAI